jgi:hypothetical protein
MKDYEEVYNRFWKEVVENEDGTLNKDQVMRELSDYFFVLDNVPKVYSHVTGGLLSKPNYEAGTVIAAADEQFEKDVLIRIADDGMIDEYDMEDLIDEVKKDLLNDNYTEREKQIAKQTLVSLEIKMHCYREQKKEEVKKK